MRRLFRFIVQVIAWSLVAVLALFIFFPQWKDDVLQFIFADQGTLATEELPPPSGPRAQTFIWNHAGVRYTISLPLYDSAYTFYAKQPKTYQYYGDLKDNWEEDYYKVFLTPAKNDVTITELAASLQKAGRERGLSDDQVIELAVSFVQAIPYDAQKASTILAAASEKPRFPYEVLYDKAGVCSDKSFLLLSIVRALGYGGALFEYEDALHMAIGIQCPKDISSYGSGYCFTETTSPGHKIGIIAELDPQNNQAVARGEIGRVGGYDSAGDTLNGGGQTKGLGNPEIFQKTSGATYHGLSETIGSMTRISSLETQIAGTKENLKSLKSQINTNNEKIDALGKKMEKLKREEKYEEYNALVPEYNNLVTANKQVVETYNAKVGEINRAIDDYNQLVKQF